MTSLPCQACAQEAAEPLEIRMAFQPIVDVARREVFAYEALVRGPEGEGAAWVLAQVSPEGRYRFDQRCRVTALRVAARLGIRTRLSINFMPEAVYEPRACIRTTLATARDVGLAPEQLMFEVVETERPRDPAHLERIFTEYRRLGFLTALDDFGSGHATTELAERLRPDLLKLDRGRVAGLDRDPAQCAAVAAVAALARRLGMRVVGEGVETPGEARALFALGITLMQGYHFARPGFEALPEVPEEAYELAFAPFQ